jgi:hypothetical protein
MQPPLGVYRTNTNAPNIKRRLGALGIVNGSGLTRPVPVETAAQIALAQQAAAYQKSLPALFKILRAYLASGDYAGAWAFAAKSGDPTKPQGRGTNAYNLYGQAVNFNPVIAILETSAGINLLKLPAFTLPQMQAFYKAASAYWDGNIIGVNPYAGTEWGDPGYIPGDAITNFNTPPDNLYPDIARFSGKHPDPSFFSKWGALIIAVVAAIVTYGVSLAATAAVAGADAAAAEGAGTALLSADELSTLAEAGLQASLPADIAASVAESTAINATAIDTALGTSLATGAAAGAGGGISTSLSLDTVSQETAASLAQQLPSQVAASVAEGAATDLTAVTTALATSVPTSVASSAGGSAASGAGAGGSGALGTGLSYPQLISAGTGALGLARSVIGLINPPSTIPPAVITARGSYGPGLAPGVLGPPGTVLGIPSNTFWILAVLLGGALLLTGKRT